MYCHVYPGMCNNSRLFFIGFSFFVVCFGFVAFQLFKIWFIY